MDISGVANLEAKAFLTQFFLDREINREIYEKIPEDKFDFRMVDRPERKSDSPRESMGHQIGTQMDYMSAIDTGTLVFKSRDNKKLKSLSKEELLQKLSNLDLELVNRLSDPSISIKKIYVPWSQTPVPVIPMFWGLRGHEVLHIGWNLAIMDHLGIERFESLRKRWG